MSAMDRRRGRWRRRVALFVSLVAVGVGGWWSGRVTLLPPAAPVSSPNTVVTAQVREVSVGRTLNYAVTVTQPFVSVATNSLIGIVTDVGTSGNVVSGDMLYAVAGRDVYAVSGETPFYRDLSWGAVGTDVAQLQNALKEWGYPVAATDEDAGRFGTSTRSQVRAWQVKTGQATTGVVTLGSILAIPSLPAVVRLGDAIVRGDPVAGGETAVLARNGDPSFALVLSSDQANLVPSGAVVDITLPDGAGPAIIWHAVVGQSSIDENGSTSIALTAPLGGRICGNDCDRLGHADHTTLMSAIYVVPATAGPGVPIAALRTAADGSTYVLAPDGTKTTVTVKASGDGIAVIDGIEVGREIVVLGASGPTSTGGSA